jgi:fucose permease
VLAVTLTLTGPSLLVAVFVFGVIWSGVFPTLAAYAMSAVPSYGGPANAVMTGASYFGIGLVPALMGVVLERSGIVTALSILPLLTVVTGVSLVVTLVVVRRRGSVAPV